MNILVVDSPGGIGKQVISKVKEYLPEAAITAMGTNGIATAAMLKAGADRAATGENAVLVGCRTADVIVGPIGIVIADALLGEVTPAMAAAIGQSPAKRILIAVNQCENIVIGMDELKKNRLIEYIG